MDIIFDPSQPDSYFAREQTIDEAHLLLCSSLPTQINPEYVEQYVSEDPRVSVLDVHEARDVRIRTLSEYCMSAVLSDGAARSFPHIAAEVCRLIAELRAISSEQGDLDTFRFDSNDTMRQSRKGVWLPAEAPFKIPTINGQPPSKPDYMSWGYLGRFQKPPLHSQWLHTMFDLLESYAKDGDRHYKVTKLEAPFTLSTGRRIEEDAMPYYRGEVPGGYRSAVTVVSAAPSGTGPGGVPILV